MTDEPGVMGNLPRSRPGRRSEKRAAEVKPAKGGASRASGASAKSSKATAKRATAKKTRTASGAKTKREAAPKPRAATSKPKAAAGSRPRPAKAQPKRTRGPAGTTPSIDIPTEDKAPPTSVRDERVEVSQGTDPITAALRLGMAVGDAGLKVVAKLAQRLPRP